MGLVNFIERHAKWITVLLVLAASLRIALTWTVFSSTTDEPGHIASGIEKLDRGTYQLEDSHPPLARMAASIGPYMFGARFQGADTPSIAGAAILTAQGQVTRTLMLARAGILPFFWVACAVVFLWAEKLKGPIEGVLAVAIFSHVPAVLGHAGLATTDMALTAMLGAMTWTALAFTERPSVRSGLIAGCVAGLAILSKFSSVPFFLSAIAGIALWRLLTTARLSRRLNHQHLAWGCLAVVAGAFVIWAFYGFSAGQIRGTNHFWPAPEFFSGLRAVKQHNALGHPSYLWGKWSANGFWNYYALNLSVRTPPALLVLVIAGIGTGLGAWRRNPDVGQPIMFTVGILGFAMAFSSVNIGIRHILPVYLGGSIVAASGLMWLFRRKYGAICGAALLMGLIGSTSFAHPDYLAYFNVFAGTQPEKLLIDSDLDWGQDMKRLAERLQELHVDEVHYLPLISPELSDIPFPKMLLLDIEHPSPGWHAANITALKFREHEVLLQTPNARFWTDTVSPTERIGSGILLWRLP